ncbi:ABC transporter ATP-binding protein [Dongia deserti]|uniref:ABC transporter ATP-binding protein n=1 Tax=Dongia deserti TaxID=2268030 RepID=UPI000E649A9B|nr:ABC transporter ATP-binding protein [Dongia deserti]
MTIVNRSAAVVLEKVRKQYGVVMAVEEVSVTIEAGTLVTLLGPSGCGKTTTLRMVAGLEMPTAGRILIGDKDVTLLPPNERDVSMVFQSYALFPHMTVLENVSYGLADASLSKARKLEKAREGLRLVGLDGYDERLPSELSGGQQQRVACARALVLEPQVLLFDEPLSNLDAKLRRRMREEIRELQQKLELTSIYVTHDQEEALAVSDKIVVMNQGRIAQEGTPADLYERPADSFVADFIGAANLIPCEILRREDALAIVRFGDTELRVRAPRISGSAGYLVVRSAAVALADAGAARGLTATVRKATYLGGHWEYTLDTPFGSLFLAQPVGRRFEQGATVALQLDPQHLSVVART